MDQRTTRIVAIVMLAAQWAMLEELGRKSREQGLSPGLHRSRALQRE